MSHHQAAPINTWNLVEESPTSVATGVEFVTPRLRYASTLDAKDNSSYQFCTLHNLLDAGLALQSDEELNFLTSKEPSSFDEAKSDACWRRAM